MMRQEASSGAQTQFIFTEDLLQSPEFLEFRNQVIELLNSCRKDGFERVGSNLVRIRNNYQPADAFAISAERFRQWGLKDVYDLIPYSYFELYYILGMPRNDINMPPANHFKFGDIHRAILDTTSPQLAAKNLNLTHTAFLQFLGRFRFFHRDIIPFNNFSIQQDYQWLRSARNSETHLLAFLLVYQKPLNFNYPKMIKYPDDIDQALNIESDLIHFAARLGLPLTLSEFLLNKRYLTLNFNSCKNLLMQNMLQAQNPEKSLNTILGLANSTNSISAIQQVLGMPIVSTSDKVKVSSIQNSKPIPQTSNPIIPVLPATEAMIDINEMMMENMQDATSQSPYSVKINMKSFIKNMEQFKNLTLDQIYRAIQNAKRNETSTKKRLTNSNKNSQKERIFCEARMNCNLTAFEFNCALGLLNWIYPGIPYGAEHAFNHLLQFDLASVDYLKNNQVEFLLNSSKPFSEFMQVNFKGEPCFEITLVPGAVIKAIFHNRDLIENQILEKSAATLSVPPMHLQEFLIIHFGKNVLQIVNWLKMEFDNQENKIQQFYQKEYDFPVISLLDSNQSLCVPFLEEECSMENLIDTIIQQSNATESYQYKNKR